MRLKRRDRDEDMRATQEMMTYELFPDRWRELHLGVSGDVEIIDGEAYSSPTEIDEDKLDAFLRSVEEPREMSGAEAGSWQDEQEAWRYA